MSTLFTQRLEATSDSLFIPTDARSSFYSLNNNFTVRESFGFSSIGDIGEGLTVHTFSSAMPKAAFSVQLTGERYPRSGGESGVNTGVFEYSAFYFKTAFGDNDSVVLRDVGFATTRVDGRS